MSDLETQVAFLVERLEQAANPEKAVQMQAYMKTEMPFYGVQKPQLKEITKAFKQEYSIRNLDELHALVEALWFRPHREEKHLALDIAAAFKIAKTPDSLELWIRLARDGAWWDLVDGIVSPFISPMYRKHREELRPHVESWSEDEDFWIRRMALLSHLKHKKQTDHEQLFRHCLKMAHEKEFFIRKAIGWILREYSKHEPERVQQFLLENREVWSGLSWREGSRWLKSRGYEMELDS